MERSFGTDLAHVRVHDHAAAATSAASMKASAYAIGNNVVFGAGSYQPNTAQGSWLLAHELGHTIQQRGVSQQAVQRKALEVGDAGDAMETAADRAADRVMSGDTNVASGLSSGEAVIRRFSDPIPWEQSSRLVAAHAGSHRVDTNVVGTVFPAGQPAGSPARFASHDDSASIAAGTSGVVQVRGQGHYEVNNGTLVEPMPDSGTFNFRTDWRYRAGQDRTLTIDEASPTLSQSPATFVFRQPISVSATAASSPTQVMTRLMLSQSGGGGPTVTAGPVSGSAPTGASTVGSFPIEARLHLNVTGGHEPAPAPTHGDAHASADAHADASATASVTMPMPAAVHAPETHSEYFEEGQSHGDRSALIRWAATIPEAAQAAIRTQRLRVTAIGFASTTGTEQRNYAVHASGRAAWARSILAQAWGVPEAQIQVGNRGDATAPAADHVGRGVPNPHERRVEIHFEEVAPMERATTTATRDAHSTASTGGTTPRP